jgi:hypothetical protein
MLSLINCLILFFILLLIYQIFLAFSSYHCMEGLENSPTSPNQYQPYDTNNPSNALILAQQNAGNIGFLKQQMDSLLGLNKEVNDISGNVVTLQDQVNQLVAAQQQYATQMTGGEAPEVSGT